MFACIFSECNFRRMFVKLTPKKFPGKVCLTNYKISQCLPKCRPTKPEETTRVPMTCVPQGQVDNLKKYLIEGTKMDFSGATEYLADVSIPEKCRCNC